MCDGANTAAPAGLARPGQLGGLNVDGPAKQRGLAGNTLWPIASRLPWKYYVVAVSIALPGDHISSGAAMPGMPSPSRSVACTAAVSASRAWRVAVSSHSTRSAGSPLPSVYQREKSAARASR